jgi:lysophospholipase L1-like esterase
MYQEPKSWMNEPVTYTINGDTLNERYDYPVQKSPNTFRIVTLGDSFTFGMYVNTYQNWSEQLEDMLNRKSGGSKRAEVINLGVPGYDIEFAAARYLDRGKKYTPDLLIWYLIGNSFVNRSSFVFTENPKVVSDLEKQGLKGKELLLSVNSLVADNLIRAYGGEETIIQYQLEQFQKLLQSVQHTRVLVLLSSDISDTELIQKVRQIASGYTNVDMRMLPVVDVLPDTHPSPIGHMQIATYVYMYLRQAGFVL